MAKVLDAVVRFRKIEEATGPKDEPAPVYLLDEILDMARQSPESAAHIAEAVNKKLGAKSPVVKFKALRLIKHLCSKGCSQFQRSMQRYASSVRELIHYKGEPDPFKGDVPNARVREFAKEVVEVMFNAAPVQNTANTLAAQGKIQGFGSAGPEPSRSQYGGIGSSGSSSGGRGSSSGGPMGNSIGLVPLHGLDGPIMQGISNAASAIGDFLNKGSGTRSSLNQDAGRWESPPNRAGGSSYGRSNFEPPTYTPHSRSGSGAGYGASGGGYGASGGGFGPSAASGVPAVSASQVLGSEEGAVDDVCTPGGLRPLPVPEDLRRFVETSASMDGLRVGELLRAKMESGNWQVVVRALAALEAVLQRGSSQSAGEVAVMFQSDPGPIRAAVASPQPLVRERAAAVLKLLLGEEVDVGQGSGHKKVVGKGAAQAAALPVADLLGEEEPAAGGSAGGAAGPGALDLLADFDAPAPASTAAAAAGAAATADALFSGLDVPVAAAPAAASFTAQSDLFGGLDLGVSPQVPAVAPAAVSAPAPGAQQAAAAPKSVPLDDLFAGLGTSDTSSTAAGQPHMRQPHQQSQAQQLPLYQQQQQQGLMGGVMGAAGSAPAGSTWPGMQQQGMHMGMQQPTHLQQGMPQLGGMAGGMAMPGAMQGAYNMGTTAVPQQPTAMGLGGPVQQPQQQLPGSYGLGGMGMPGVPSNGNFGGPMFQQQHQQVPGGMMYGGGQHQQQPHGVTALPGQLHAQQQLMQLGGAGLQGHPGSGGSGNVKAWTGHDDVSNLMRHVASGGKHDPAFDFVSAEFAKRKA